MCQNVWKGSLTETYEYNPVVTKFVFFICPHTDCLLKILYWDHSAASFLGTLH